MLHEGDPPWSARGWPLEYDCDFRDRLGRLLKGDDRWWRVRSWLPAGGTARDLLRGLETTGLPWLELHSDPRRYLTQALDDPARVSFMNLHSLVRVAHRVGTAAETEAAEAEQARWKHGERAGDY